MSIYAFDTETHLIAPGNLAPKLVCATFATPGKEPKIYLADEAAYELAKLLEDGHILVGHNGAFDFGVMVAFNPEFLPLIFRAYAEGRIRDTKVRQQLLDIEAGCLGFPRQDGTKGYSLADLEQHYLGKDRSDEKKNPDSWRVRYAELDGVPLSQWPQEAVTYPLADAQGTLDVYLAQGESYAPEAALTNEEEQCRAAWALHLMSCHGICTDGEAVAKLKKELLAEKKSNFARLSEAGFYKGVPLSAEDKRQGKEADYTEPPKKEGKPPRLMKFSKDMDTISARVEAAYQTLGRSPPTTESGRIATDKDTLNQSGDELLALLGDAGGTDKLLTTYIPVLEQGVTTPINARYNILVNSGRTSCATPNLQNLPRRGLVRETFVPRLSQLFISVDYDTLELRALAQVCLNLFGHSKMAEQIRAGRDLHLAFAAELLGIPYEEAEARKKDPDVKEARQFAKVANFGLPGGLGADTLIEFARTSYGVTMTRERAVELKAQWLEAYPEMREYFAYISALVGLGGAPITQMVSERVRGNCGYCDGCNTLFQGLAADGAKQALWEVALECYLDRGTALFGCRPVAFIHDEIIMEAPADKAHEAAVRLAEVMCAAMSKYIRDVPITATPALMSRWFKNAEAKYDTSGRLVPWAPES